MAEMITNASHLIEQLNSLIALDFDAIEAYEAAIVRLNDAKDKVQVTRFVGDHHRHLMDLVPLVREFGGEPTTKADFKRVLTNGKVVLTGMAAERAVLGAMKSNEATTTRTYRNAIDDDDSPARMRAILERNFADEQRHLAWIEQRLAFASGAPAHR
jgi:uncharacterized protein (TIGR02284 family)